MGVAIRYPLIIWYAILLHAIYGYAILSSDAAFGATPLSTLNELFPQNSLIAVGILFATVVLAIVALYWHIWWGTVLLVPQQTLLIISAWGSLHAILRGSYADGVLRPVEFILADQLPNILIAVLHFAAMVLRGRAKWATLLGLH